MRLWISSLLITCVLALGGLTAFSVPALRWRAHLVELKASGQVPELSWEELAHLIAPDSNADASLIFKTKDPYSGVFAPAGTPQRVQAGHELFNQQCAACHGVDAKGGMAPNLSKGEFSHGASD